MAKIVELIYSNNQARGKGTPGSPHRLVEEWFEKDGNLVFEKDPFKESVNNLEVSCRTCEHENNCYDEVMGKCGDDDMKYYKLKDIYI